MNERAFSTTNDSLVENQALNWDITNVFIRYDCKIKDWKNRVYHLRNQTQLKQRDDFFNIIILSHKFPDWIPLFHNQGLFEQIINYLCYIDRSQLWYQWVLYWEKIWGQKGFG